MAEFHQFVHSYVDHDAISSHTRHLQYVIRELGMRSEVYAHEWRGLKSKASDFREFRPTEPANDTWLLYQLGTESPIANFLADRPEHVAVSYHNFTPAPLLEPWEPLIAAEVGRARAQMVELANRAEMAWGVSAFNEAELRAAHYKKTANLPVLFDAGDFQHGIDERKFRELQSRKESGGKDWLFVGRVAPHKCQHDIIKAFAAYQRSYDPDAHLYLVGGVSSHLYWTTLKKFIDALQVSDSVTLTGSVPDGVLGAHYKNADVFVCLSEHEGFGVPVLEAMAHDLPVVAFDAGAVGETMGDGGVLLDAKAPGYVATAVRRVLHDEALNVKLRYAGARRLAQFALPVSQQRWADAIEAVVKG